MNIKTGSTSFRLLWFDMFSTQPQDLKLVLNADKSKVMFFFTNSEAEQVDFAFITTLNGTLIELAAQHTSLEILIDDCLSFKSDVRQPVRRMKLKLFLFLILETDLYSPLRLWRHQLYACFLTVSSHTGELFIMDHWDSSPVVMFLLIIARVRWPSVFVHRLNHWYTFLYKAVLGLLPSYLCSCVIRKAVGSYNLHSRDLCLLSLPHVCTDLGKTGFMYSAPSTWDVLQRDFSLVQLVSPGVFRSLTNDKLIGTPLF